MHLHLIYFLCCFFVWNIFNKTKEEPIDFIRKLNESYTAAEKETIELECEVNKDNVKCIWKKYGKEIVPDERTKIEVKGRVQRLIFSNLNLDDKQNITCVALKNNDEVASTSGRLNVNGKLNIEFYKAFNIIYCFSFQLLIIQCTKI